MEIALILKALKDNWKAIAVVAVLAASFWVGRGWERGIVAQTQLDALVAAVAAKDEAIKKAGALATDFEKKQAELRAANRQFIKKQEVELENHIYSDCLLPANGVQLIKSNVSVAGSR